MRIILISLALFLSACTTLPQAPDLFAAEHVEIQYKRDGSEYDLTYKAQGHNQAKLLDSLLRGGL